MLQATLRSSHTPTLLPSSSEASLKARGFYAHRSAKVKRGRREGDGKRTSRQFATRHDNFLGARLRGRTATQRSKKGSEKILGRVLGKGSQKGSEKGACYGLYSKEGSEKGSEKGVSSGCLECPLGEYAPLGVRPTFEEGAEEGACGSEHPSRDFEEQ